jgi:hypothetical protein
MRRIVKTSIFVLVFVGLIGAKAVYAAPPAYIDPNTGGMLFQMLAVVFTLLSGLLFFFSSRIKMAFARFMRFLREKRGKQQPIQGKAQDTTSTS